MSEFFETFLALDDRYWRSDRRQWIAAAGLSFTGALPLMLNADQVEGQPVISAELADKFRAIRFGIELSEVEWTSRLIDSFVAAGGKPNESNAKAISDVWNYYQNAWRLAQTQFDWAKEISAQRDAEIAALVAWSLSRYPLNGESKAAIARGLEQAGGPAKLAAANVDKLRKVGISAAEARRAAYERNRVPSDDNNQQRSEVACSLIASQIIAAALCGQWELLTTTLVKLQISGCL